MISELNLKNPVSGHARFGRMSAPEKPKAVMLLVHGFGEHSGRYEPMMAHLADHDIAVIALDLEGHGQSGGRRGVCRSYDVLLADVDLLKAKAKADFPGLPVFLYGHSMGGGLALHYVLKHGDDGLNGVIASAPLIHPAEPVPGPLRALVKILRPVLPNMTIGNEISGDKVSSVPDEQKRYEQDPLNHGRLGLGLATGIIEGGEWVADNAERWNTPLLLIHAEADKLTQFNSSREFAANAQNCEFHPMADCEHEMHNDSVREDVYGKMTAFMKARI